MNTSKEIIKQAEKDLREQFEIIDEIRDYNQEKVLNAFIDNRVAPEHFYTVSGYGHDDLGREVLDKVFAQVFKAEKALVRIHFASGTHTLACALFGNLRHGDKLISAVGTPYDTMQEVIGTMGDEETRRASLIGNGVLYDEVPLLNGTDVDYEKLEEMVDDKTTMVLIQRSKGYSTRKSLTIDVIEKICKIIKSKNPDCICFVDNCYGEFVDTKEPIEVGADLIGGSLIKNAGGGIVEAGGYIAGKELYVERAATRLTAPGIGSEGGAMFNQHRLIFQGLFMAPSVVSEAVKGAVLAAKIFDEIGYDSSPKYNEKRTDIIQNITFGSPEPLEHFCRTIQSLSPVNGYVTPIPEYIPGYEDKVIMAGGTFIEGSTIELSADGPMRAPYVAYMQGGLNYAHVKIALTKILDRVK
ncbi:MAG: methionine gamma-lyase family protein [Candidatus Gastranaerophilaceae bacterium]|jgi:cystathionine beta-lyase family protein involved in aluminum resistance|nr:aluminum resistance family protein [bacterium]CDE92007.1 aluminium resistance protein [Fusobacterium sp. CAG:815]DAA88794.1 MAG TPA: aluminum resistance family protein [Candidatus Gastranaerophilales bacterium HUM_6]DAA92230.1 MAG TPA: aluminum resistance family protein [Candidatus Gastranaerophilales bacterium HUM_7]DAB08392.1 MAG TPA: aluminum resistance family protein [Candidatus Gastranaerophilales bacterium HUM_14]